MSLKLEKKYTAFIDILGWSHAAERAHTNQKLAFRMNSVLENLRIQSEKYNAVMTSHFSDCILLSFAFNPKEQSPQKISEQNSFFLHFISDLSKIYLKHGFLVRGGVTLDYMHHTNDAAFGKAFNRAYELEQKWAIYPRIVIEPNDVMIDWADTVKITNPGNEHPDFTWSLIQEAPDGLHYLDILHNTQFEYDVAHRDFSYLETIRNYIEAGLDEHQGDPNIFAKYYWMANYFNNSIDDQKCDISGIDIMRYG